MATDKKLVHRWVPPRSPPEGHPGLRAASDEAFLKKERGLEFSDVRVVDLGFDGEAWVTEFHKKGIF